MSDPEKKAPLNTNENEQNQGNSSSMQNPDNLEGNASAPPPASPDRPPPPGFHQNGPQIHYPQPAGPPSPGPVGDNNGVGSSAGPYSVPPPSYQTAMSYPAAPTYGANYDLKYGQPVTQPPYYPPNITQTRLPQPQQQQTSIVVRPASNVVVQVQSNCRLCNSGVIVRQTDMCCLICLILLTIFTFPFGLVFLCCVPCTVQNRCSNCNRIQL